MGSSFTPTEDILNLYLSIQDDFPYEEIHLTRLSMHTYAKLLEYRNKNFKTLGINETLFMALIILNTQEDKSIQPSELSLALGSSRTNATRIADDLEKKGWIVRKESDRDRRCLHLFLTQAGQDFLNSLLPQQNANLLKIWSAFSKEEREQLDLLNRKLLTRLETLDPA
ncbi:transcriptional regulator [Leminorella grimontii]|uniref:Transcriptional regulator n=1 Tax=Leminorella grimontii TaxID=82981 RepID=A0AAV5N2L1_9GAMM|nr:transcriptional repressor MprA [Leminorella grimontii]KFC95066.1 transcription repressor [Leminorella grimontii ATCC 33999 = DSM 5078]GKX56336.1 transcriptional regulator [Leminorella grimontii]GKX61381.1 transcriptional regulator [Leminorella grimontii]VFS60720.1 transcriptional repressor MprA [Leminorella grimontii]